ncbi:hypothetical protein [Streptomyces antimycoticus]|uniref:hypothetical protein n=1 Tax=Streptomyces antimycoticus TaxID=68175 RepID=UPI00367EDD81
MQEASPNTCRAPARRAARTPAAVGPPELPVPPCSWGAQYAYGEKRRRTTMSSGPVPTSGPVRYEPTSIIYQHLTNPVLDPLPPETEHL